MSEPPWDVVVIGAGPAGCACALALRRHPGTRVLLVERELFPRAKVCGGCVNPAALAALATLGLRDLPDAIGAQPFDTLALRAGARTARIRASGVAVSRSALDLALFAAARAAGVTCVDGCRARIAPHDPTRAARELVLTEGTEPRTVTARAVVVATGLGRGTLTDRAELAARADPHSRIGAGATLPATDLVARGVIEMCWHRHGYVGLAHAAHGVSVAAAFDSRWVQQSGGLAGAAATIVAAAGSAPRHPELARAIATLRFRGTPPLTTKAERAAGARVFLVGDAAGYVEPFTGEGIAWALQSGIAVAPFVHAALSGDATAEARFARAQRTLVSTRQRTCRVVAAALRSPAVTRLAVGALARWPALAAPVVARVSAPTALTAVPLTR